MEQPPNKENILNTSLNYLLDLVSVGQRAVDWWIDTGKCFFCNADMLTNKAHDEDHCNIGKLAEEYMRLKELEKNMINDGT